MYEGISTDILQQIMLAYYARTILHNWNSLPSHKCNIQVSDYSASVTTILSLILTYFNFEITKDMWLHKAILSTILYFLCNNMSLILILTDNIPFLYILYITFSL